MQNANVITQVREVGDVLSGGEKRDALFAGLLHGNYGCVWRVLRIHINNVGSPSANEGLEENRVKQERSMGGEQVVGHSQGRMELSMCRWGRPRSNRAEALTI